MIMKEEGNGEQKQWIKTKTLVHVLAGLAIGFAIGYVGATYLEGRTQMQYAEQLTDACNDHWKAQMDRYSEIVNQHCQCIF